MALVKVLARDWKVEIESENNFVVINGINSFTIEFSKSDANTTSFDTAGWDEHIVASRGATITVEGFYLEDPSTGERDPGQAAVESLAEKVGHESIGRLRLTSPGGKSKIYKVSAQTPGVGGGVNDPASWSATFTVSGKPEDDNGA